MENNEVKEKKNQIVQQSTANNNKEKKTICLKACEFVKAHCKRAKEEAFLGLPSFFILLFKCNLKQTLLLS